MKIPFLTLLILLLSSCLHLDADYGVDADAGLYLRSGPGVGYPALTLLKNGSDVTVLDWNSAAPTETLYGKTGNWIKVRAADVEGWTFSPFVAKRSGLFHFIYTNFLGLAFYLVAFVLIVKLGLKFWDKHQEKERARGAALLKELQAKQDAKRRESLIAEFGAEDGSRIADGHLWIGMTQEMVVKSWGSPAHTDLHVKSDSRTEYWYYAAFKNNRGNIKYKKLLTVKNGVLEAYQDL